MQCHAFIFIVVGLLFLWFEPHAASSLGGWNPMKSMCASGKFHKTYAYADGTSGLVPGKALSATQAQASVHVCADALNKDSDCSKEFVGIDEKNGRCYCVLPRDACTKTKSGQFQFRLNQYVYTKFGGLNCENAHNVSGRLKVANFQTCQARCDEEKSCSCVVFNEREKMCILQKQCLPVYCEKNRYTDTYQKQIQEGDFPVRPRRGITVVANFPFIPLVYWSGEFSPICGIGFWDNNDGAAAVCRTLGFNKGTVQKAKKAYPEAALSGYGTAGATVDERACRARNEVSVTVTCSDHRLSTMTSTTPPDITTTTTTTAEEVVAADDSPAAPLDVGLVVGIASGSAGGLLVVSLVVALICVIRGQSERVKNDEVIEMPHRPKVKRNASMEIAGEAHQLLMHSDLIISADEIVMEANAIAAGGGGQVFLGMFGSTQVALKENFSSLGCGATVSDQKETIQEAGILTKLRHPHIVTFFGLWSPDTPADNEIYGLGARILLVLEYCANGDLTKQILEPTVGMELRLQWTQQIAQALKFLHRRHPPIIHRDIKPENVLLDAKNNAKVADFGGSKLQVSERDQTVSIGTIAYMPPEVLADSGKDENDRNLTIDMDGTKWDVFSYAVMVTYILSGKAPHPGLRNQQIFMKVGMRDERTAIPDAITDKRMAQLIKRMWHREPEKRPSFKVIVRELRELQRDTDGSESDILSSSDEDSSSS